MLSELQEEREKKSRESDKNSAELHRALARAAEEKRLREKEKQNIPRDLVEYKERCESLEVSE